MDDYANQNAAIDMYRPKGIVERDENRSELDETCEDIGFGFKDMLKLTKQTRKIQSRIDKRLGRENRGGLSRLSCSFWDEVRKAAGGRANNLDALYDSQHDLVKRICGGLYGINHLCRKHYLALVSFRQSSNERLCSINSLRPGIERKTRDVRGEYVRAAQQLSRLRKSDPGYYESRERLARLRDMLNQASHAVDIAGDIHDVIDRIAIGVDSAASLLLHGKNTVDKLLERYSITEDYLDRALPALNFTRDIMRNTKLLYELNKTISESIRQAEAIEAKIENPRLLTRVQREVPALSGRSTVDVIDYLNSAMQTRRDYVQNTWR